jgi:hypothetical protein
MRIPGYATGAWVALDLARLPAVLLGLGYGHYSYLRGLQTRSATIHQVFTRRIHPSVGCRIGERTRGRLEGGNEGKTRKWAVSWADLSLCVVFGELKNVPSLRKRRRGLITANWREYWEEGNAKFIYVAARLTLGSESCASAVPGLACRLQLTGDLSSVD